MKVTVSRTIYETVDIDDKFAPLLEKSVKAETDRTITFTDEEETLWDELIRLADNNKWYTGYSVDEKNMYWEI